MDAEAMASMDEMHRMTFRLVQFTVCRLRLSTCFAFYVLYASAYFLYFWTQNLVRTSSAVEHVYCEQRMAKACGGCECSLGVRVSVSVGV